MKALKIFQHDMAYVDLKDLTRRFKLRCCF